MYIFDPILKIDVTALREATFGEGNGQIFLSRLKCSGNETTLLNCSSGMAQDCDHFRDAGVRCEGINIQNQYFVKNYST